MKDPIKFDVLVVYSDFATISASSNLPQFQEPFSPLSDIESYNEVYGCFLKTCQKKGMTIAFSTSADIIGAGTCRSYWLFENNNWKKVKEPCYSKNIFDKFSPVNKIQRQRRKLLFSDKTIKPFNSKDLMFFTDKLKTYEKLEEFAIPTVSIESANKKDILKAIQDLDKLVLSHPNSQDFTAGYVLKDRLGAGGNNIYKISNDFVSQIKKIMRKETNTSFVLQPFVSFDQGYEFEGESAPTDIRLIYMDGKIVQNYIRIAKEGEFRCNEHKGGDLVYLSADYIPQKVIKKSQKIVDRINIDNNLYALDYIISNNGNVYFLEGNNNPGLDWNEDKKLNKKKSIELAGIIASEFSRRIDKFSTADN